ncbi:hypothetical protein Scep_006978 [Stephania cephalantha]|uniref:Uncharacterized protein n=1 Tax=Stephania cephalantha TaxID=152367 RepID=A0AAP0K8Z7_9MAGN
MHATPELTLPALDACSTSSLEWSTPHTLTTEAGATLSGCHVCMIKNNFKMQCRLNSNPGKKIIS